MTITVEIDGEPVEVVEADWNADQELITQRVRDWRERQTLRTEEG